jgi:hypothetical protein
VHGLTERLDQPGIVGDAHDGAADSRAGMGAAQHVGGEPLRRLHRPQRRPIHGTGDRATAIDPFHRVYQR